MELTLDLPGLVKPRVTECMEWLQGDAENEDAVECGWRQPLEEDEASSHLYLQWSHNLCPRKFHLMKSWFQSLWYPQVVPFWGDRIIRMEPPQWEECFYAWRHTELPSPSPVWGYNKKCVTRKDPPWSRCGIPFPLFISPRYFVMANPEDLRQHPNNLQKVQ